MRLSVAPQSSIARPAHPQLCHPTCQEFTPLPQSAVKATYRAHDPDDDLDAAVSVLPGGITSDADHRHCVSESEARGVCEERTVNGEALSTQNSRGGDHESRPMWQSNFVNAVTRHTNSGRRISLERVGERRGAPRPPRSYGLFGSAAWSNRPRTGTEQLQPADAIADAQPRVRETASCQRARRIAASSREIAGSKLRAACQ